MAEPSIESGKGVHGTDVPVSGGRAGWVSGALVFTVYVALLHWNTVGLPLIRDEGEYAYAAWMWGQGFWPYSDVVLQKPPMVIYTYWLALWADNGSGLAFRVLAVVFAWGAGLVMGEIAAKQIGAGARWPARLLLPALMLMPGMGQAMANTEAFMLLPFLGVWWLSVCRGGAASGRLWFAAGSLAGIALMYKYTCVAPLCVILAYWAAQTHHVTGSARQTVLRKLAGLCGAMVCVLAICLPFLLRDGGAAFFECTVGFNRDYAQAHLMKNRTWRHWQEMGLAWMPLVVLAGVWLGAGLRRAGLFSRGDAGRQKGGDAVRSEVFVVALLAVTAVFTMLSPYQQYYMVLLPCLAYGSAGGCVAVGEWLRKKTLWPKVGEWAPIAAVVAAALAPNAGWLMESREGLAERLPWASQFKETAAVAEKIDSLSRPEQRILVAGSEPQVLYGARRASSTRFINAYSFMIPTRYSEAYQRTAVEEIRQNPPEVIAIATDSKSWMTNPQMPLVYHLSMEYLLERDYELVASYCQTESGMAWIEDPGAARHPSAAWVIFVRRKGLPAGRAQDYSDQERVFPRSRLGTGFLPL